jgi:dihydropteroate synthase
MSKSADFSRHFPHRARRWQLRTRELDFGPLPRLMGIVNVTPDSFSDGGKFLDPQAAIDHALRLVDDGADILDIGGESTRPYATPVRPEEELARVLPVIREVYRLRPSAILSIDTSKPLVAAAAIDAGAEIINDVTGLSDDTLLQLACSSQAGICVMHMQGTPQTMQDNPFYNDVVDDILAYQLKRRDTLLTSGIHHERICLDPGIGFGKTHAHNLTLMANCWRFHELGCPLLVGHSRKGFIGKLISNKDADRTAGTIGGALALARQGVQVIRVHDVRAVREALLLFEACGGLEPFDASLSSPLEKDYGGS